MIYDTIHHMEVEILRHPEQEDWERCKMLALNTIGKKYAGTEITDAWKHAILKAEHSPIRTLMFTIRLTIPYFVSVHLVRHKIGIEHYVQSQRNDRQTNYLRAKTSWKESRTISGRPVMTVRKPFLLQSRRECSRFLENLRLLR